MTKNSQYKLITTSIKKINSDNIVNSSADCLILRSASHPVYAVHIHSSWIDDSHKYTDESIYEDMQQLTNVINIDIPLTINSAKLSLFDENVALELSFSDDMPSTYNNDQLSHTFNFCSIVAVNEFLETLDDLYSDYENTKSTLYRLINDMKDALNALPQKGNTSQECQKSCILNSLSNLDNEVNGISLLDFIIAQ